MPSAKPLGDVFSIEQWKLRFIRRKIQWQIFFDMASRRFSHKK